MRLLLTFFPPQMNTDVCEHYGRSICSYFWDKLMRNLNATAWNSSTYENSQLSDRFPQNIPLRQILYYTLECWLHALSGTWLNMWFYSCVDRFLSTTPFQQAKNIWPTTRKFHTLGFEQPITSFANNKTKLQKLQISEIKKQ